MSTVGNLEREQADIYKYIWIERQYIEQNIIHIIWKSDGKEENMNVPRLGL